MVWFHSHRVQVDVPGESVAGEAIVVTPSSHMTVGRDALASLRADSSPGKRDHQLVEAIRDDYNPRVLSFVFRATAGDATWRFASGLSQTERDELAYLMYLGHVKVNRALASIGIFDVVYAEWGGEEIEAFANATTRIASEIRARGRLRPSPDTPEAQLARLDLWIASNLGLFRALPLDVAIRDILPRRMRRRLDEGDRQREMIAGLPAGWDQL